jgi:hypothetical protein
MLDIPAQIFVKEYESTILIMPVLPGKREIGNLFIQNLLLKKEKEIKSWKSSKKIASLIGLKHPDL